MTPVTACTQTQTFSHDEGFHSDQVPSDLAQKHSCHKTIKITHIDMMELLSAALSPSNVIHKVPATNDSNSAQAQGSRLNQDRLSRHVNKFTNMSLVLSWTPTEPSLAPVQAPPVGPTCYLKAVQP